MARTPVDSLADRARIAAGWIAVASLKRLADARWFTPRTETVRAVTRSDGRRAYKVRLTVRAHLPVGINSNSRGQIYAEESGEAEWVDGGSNEGRFAAATEELHAKLVANPRVQLTMQAHQLLGLVQGGPAAAIDLLEDMLITATATSGRAINFTPSEVYEKRGLQAAADFLVRRFGLENWPPAPNVTQRSLVPIADLAAAIDSISNAALRGGKEELCPKKK